MTNRLLAALVLVGCGSHGHGGSLLDGSSADGSSADGSSGGALDGVQLGDISILLPLPRDAGELAAALGPSASARGGALLPATIADKISLVPYASLRAVAVRFDPCFGQIGPIVDPSTCTNQLRIVFEEIDQPGVAVDAAIHAFYQLTRAELVAAIDEIVAARRADAGDGDLGPLAPHPLAVSQGLSGDFATKLFAIITHYAGAANFTRFTELVEEPISGGSGSGVTTFWDLTGFDMASGTSTQLVIPSLPSSATDENVVITMPAFQTTPMPMTTSSDNMFLLANLAQATAASATARQTALDAALRIENPVDASPNTIDCASCHMTTPARQLVVDKLGMSVAGNPFAFVPDPSIPAADLAQTTQALAADGRTLDIHAFSYVGSAPMINQRVINETAANLAYLRTLK